MNNGGEEVMTPTHTATRRNLISLPPFFIPVENCHINA